MSKFLFRVDAGGKVGLGHFYRSWHLARELKKRGHTVEFIHRASHFWKNLVGFDFIHSNLDTEKELVQTLAILKAGDFHTFFVDGMLEFEEEAFKTIKELVKVVFYQVNTASRHLSDIFILPSIHQEADFFSVFDSKTKIFQGLRYFTFNQDISSLSTKPFESLEDVKNVGIITGGSDPENVLLRVYNMIDFKEFEGIIFSFFFGENFLHLNTIPLKVPKNVVFSPFDFDQIVQTELLVSTFGVSTYEFMCLGMPILSLGHQKSNAYASKVLAQRTNAIFHLGDINELNSKDLIRSLKRFINDKSSREFLVINSKKTIDLKGVDRVVNILENE
ncbi:hypothetical protein [Algoriphagus resistens]|uniref:hypothetical protein n=1 Tax=Algoriphagus resistens TaxID=1750590 RepID=UPI000716815C|nr:hypothetical protein [Algoriphagus resistens]